MIRVLLIEDSLTMQAALTSLLEAVGGFKLVATAMGETSATSWILANQSGWDLAVVDILLSDGSGFGALRRCKAVHPGGRAVVFSAFLTEVLREKCHALGADATFVKTDIKELTEYLERLSRRGA